MDMCMLALPRNSADRQTDMDMTQHIYFYDLGFYLLLACSPCMLSAPLQILLVYVSADYRFDS